MQLIIASAALLVASASASGMAQVFNNCKVPVYAWSVANSDGQPPMHTIAPGSQYNETFRIPATGGISIKLNTKPEVTGPITQFEYTIADGKIWYDISNVNCGTTNCPFKPMGWYLDLTDTSCPTRDCAADAPSCSGAYIAWNDDLNSLACPVGADLMFHLCSQDGASSKRSTEEVEAPAVNRRHAHHVVRHPHWRSAD